MNAKQPHDPRIVLTGIGHFHPPNVLDNNFFDALDIGSSAAWITERVGITSRHSVLDPQDVIKLRRGETTGAQLAAAGRVMSLAAMSRPPWEMAVARAAAHSTAPLAVDHVIAGTSVPDWDIPANACAIAGELGLQAAAFDVNSACSSFVVDLHVARGLMLTGSASTVAVFTPERYTTRTDYADRSSSVLFGDAATAAVLQVERTADAPVLKGLRLLDTVVHSDPAGFAHVQLPDGGFFHQNGQAVQKFAVTKTVAVTLEVLERNGLRPEDLAYFVAHQANFRMLGSACQKAGITPAQHLYNVDTKGNQGAAGAPAVLSEHWDRYRPGDYVVMAVVGSGLTWAAALFQAV